MSGDVQHRKRKDIKKKRKEDEALNEDVNIHVHKEGVTGGNFCAKFVFFFLFSALIVLIGLIIKENQGLNDLESLETESRFSDIFEGWVDKNADDHEEDNSNEALNDYDVHDDHDDEDEGYESEEKQEESQEDDNIDENAAEEDDDDDTIVSEEEESEEETENNYKTEEVDDIEEEKSEDENAQIDEETDEKDNEDSEEDEEYIRNKYSNENRESRWRRNKGKRDLSKLAYKIIEKVKNKKEREMLKYKHKEEDDQNSDQEVDDSKNEKSSDEKIKYMKTKRERKTFKFKYIEKNNQDIGQESEEIKDQKSSEEKTNKMKRRRERRTFKLEYRDDDDDQQNVDEESEEPEVEKDSEKSITVNEDEKTTEKQSEKIILEDSKETQNENIGSVKIQESQEQVDNKTIYDIIEENLDIQEKEHKEDSETSTVEAKFEENTLEKMNKEVLKSEMQKDNKEEAKDTKSVSDHKIEDENDKVELTDKKEQTKDDYVFPEQTEAEDKVPGQEKETTNLSTKIGVGAALLAVAYNVFLGKKKSDTGEKIVPRIITPVQESTPTPDLSRRNTFIPPPTLEEIEPDLPDMESEEAYSDEEEYSEEDSRGDVRSPRDDYQELRTTYAYSLTPEGKFDSKDRHFDEDILENEDIEEIEDEIEDIEELDEEEIDDDYDKYDEDEDEELLKRLEAKYGKLGRELNVEENIESQSDDEYENSHITNRNDYKIKETIDAAEKHILKNAAYANKLFDALLQSYPLSPRILYGKAQSLDVLAEERQSNELLENSLEYYSKVLYAPDVTDALYIMVAERYINRARFMGKYRNAIATHWRLIERFPDNPTYLNNLAITYLTINLVEESRSVLKKVLKRWPNNGLALVHYGFILKTSDNKFEEAVKYLVKGLKTKEPGVIDGRFYFHLGDALMRLNKKDEAMKIHEEGVREKVFMSKYQRSLYNVPRLTAKPWWDSKDLPAYNKLLTSLKEYWKEIRNEGLSVLNKQGYFQDEAENLRDTGTWKQFELFARGQKSTKNCAKSPVTCGIIQKFVEASGCRRGQTKFSVMHPGTHVWPHCGPTNCRLRVHLGLKVPPKTFIRVAEQTRSWKEGDVIIFDDSFEHEVWHNGSDFRLVLIVDVWHPELTSSERKTLTSI